MYRLFLRGWRKEMHVIMSKMSLLIPALWYVECILNEHYLNVV